MKKEVLYRQLIDRYLEGNASPEEVEVFFHLLNKGELDRLLKDAAVNGVSLEPAPVRRMVAWKKYSVAAAVILLVGAGVFFLTRSHKGPEAAPVANVFKNDVAPGGNKAVLTLGDGSRIVLDSAEKGNLASQGKTNIVKTDAGKLAYNVAGANGGATAAPGATVDGKTAFLYNTLSTPAGGQYQVTLADGTKVWLNALSKLRFPNEFSGSDRTVDLTGEAYFEIAKDKSRPFMVRVNGVQVQVLGTSFNVNAYSDESEIKTTLLEGAVRLVKGEVSAPLKPGQQGVTGMPDAGGTSGGAQSNGASAQKGANDAQSNGASGQRAAIATSGFSIHSADIDQVMAWKNGLFSWDAADVHTVMRQISRWYGVEVRYEGTPTKALFGGEIGRDLTLTQVLTGLSKSKVHFQLEGKILTVLP
ncbi:MAG TPA: FecR domain-containing protein [Puia sp.]|nr:FecR domain-containing protein [Puia sp.]